jgi:glycosyltransferase involved in cell wall biosynthesis
MTTAENPERLALAIISNAQTPYRMHLHRRIAAEVPEIRLWSVFTHEFSNAPWKYDVDASAINPVLFGSGETCEGQSGVRNILREWRKGGEIIRWMRAHSIAAAVVFGYNDAGLLRIVRWLKARRIPCLLFGDSNVLCDSGPRLKRMVKRAVLPPILRMCTACLYCGHLGREYFLRYKVRPEALFPFPYEPDYAGVANIPPEIIRETRLRFGLDENRRRIIFSGRLAQVKRVDLLIDAFAQIAGERPNWDLILAGDGPLRDALRERVPPELRGRVQWTGFVDSHDTLSALYALSDVLVLPSDYEPWGVVVTEAAVRLALVTSSVVGAAADLVRDGVNGRIFERGNLESLRRALLEVTGETVIDGMKAASPLVLGEWRAASDPVRGLTAALQWAGVARGSVQ